MNLKRLKNCFAILCGGAAVVFVLGRMISFHCSEELKRGADTVAKQQVDISDEQLTKAVINRIRDRYRMYREEPEMLLHMTDIERTVYCAGTFGHEMERGGMLNYFASCKLQAPYLLDALSDLNAGAYRQMVYDFVHKNKLDLNSLEQFTYYNQREYEILYWKYPFQKFDENYKSLQKKKTLEAMVGSYIRNHIEKL